MGAISDIGDVKRDYAILKEGEVVRKIEPISSENNYHTHHALRLSSAILLQFKNELEANKSKQVVVGSASSISTNSTQALFAGITSFSKEKLRRVTNTNVQNAGCIDGVADDSRDKNDPILVLWKIYGQLYLKQDLFSLASNYAFNDYIKPKVGEGICTVPAVLAVQWARFVQCNYNPNFHYAPIILVDEQDKYYITLENWAVADAKACNDLWGFCVYSFEPTSKRTYHNCLTNGGGYGNIAITFTINFAV